MHRTLLAVAVALAVLGGPAAAQDYGDTQTTYVNGVVYDDDLVPGQAQNRSFYGAGQTDSSSYEAVYGGGYGSLDRNRPQNSPDLIGADGRLRSDR